jgi:hypothetical protein
VKEVEMEEVGEGRGGEEGEGRGKRCHNERGKGLLSSHIRAGRDEVKPGRECKQGKTRINLSR